MQYTAEYGVYRDYSPNYDYKRVIESIKEIPRKLKEYIDTLQEKSQKYYMILPIKLMNQWLNSCILL